MTEEEGMDESWPDDGKRSGSATSEKHGSKDMMPETAENSMEKQPILTMDFAGARENTRRMSLLKDHGKHRIQICFRITEKAWKHLEEISRLFEMTESDYAKACLYKDLGVWTERLDYRRRKRR